MTYSKNVDKGRGHTVTVIGEVKNPGTYALRQGEKVSSILLQAGGFTAQAYPYGTVFTRAGERIVVEADYTILQVKPELDMLLAPQDIIYVPQRPLSVTVKGAVENPMNLQFVTAQYAQDYIRQAGGFACDADRARVYVTYPDGHSCLVPSAAWNYAPLMIPPGSVITVPSKCRD